MIETKQQSPTSNMYMPDTASLRSAVHGLGALLRASIASRGPGAWKDTAGVEEKPLESYL